MKVLLSIKPEFAEKILNGTKKFEFRKGIFKNNNITTVVIYATMPVGKVVGQFSIDGILKNDPEALWVKTKNMPVSPRIFLIVTTQVEKQLTP